MRTSILITLFVCVLSMAGSALGSAIPTVVIDENGNGTYNGNALEHGFNGTLYYILPFVVTAGDIAVQEPLSNDLSDLLRFQPVAGAAFTQLFVYSELPEAGETPSLADVGVPAVGTNVLYFYEAGVENGWNGLSYQPSSLNDPGSVATNSILYNFTSDVPEPMTIALFGLGGAALLRRKR